MLLDKDLEVIRKTLPRFPEEVIQSWLAEYVRSEGWPPGEKEDEVPLGRWGMLLLEKPVSYWSSLSWKKKTIQLSDLISNLTPQAESRIAGMIQAFYFGIDNEYYKVLGVQSQVRLSSILTYLSVNEALPVAPVILDVGDGIFTIADGNHRIAAALYHTARKRNPYQQYQFEIECWFAVSPFESSEKLI